MNDDDDYDGYVSQRIYKTILKSEKLITMPNITYVLIGYDILAFRVDR